MLNENLATIVKRAEGSKVGLDLILLVVVFLILWLAFRKRPRVFVVLFVAFAIAYSLNEVLVTQTITVYSKGEVGELEILNDNRSPFRVSSRTKILMILPVVFSGMIQLVNLIDGSRKFTLSKTIATNLVMNLRDRTVYRTRLTEKLPEKVIYLCQHGAEALDLFDFLGYVPDTHQLTVINDFFGGGNISKTTASIIQGLFATHLYGGHMIYRSDKANLKKDLSKLVDIMNEPIPRVFCIWPSGKVWNHKAKNGVESFKAGAFYMSAYTGIPVCIIHHRISDDIKTCIIEQSNIVRPPPITLGNMSYTEFYETESYKPVIEEYRLRVENLYRSIDDRLAAELTKE